MTKSGDAGEDLISSLGPYKRPRPLIGARDVPGDSGFEFLRAAMHAAAQLLLSEGGKPPLDQVDPGRPGRREVHVVARMAGKPSLDTRRLVCAVVVQNQMEDERQGQRH